MSVTGVILAGGRGRRLGGADKGLVVVAGRPLVSWVAAALAPQVADIVVSANRSQGEYAALGLPAIDDGDRRYAGPLAGMAACLAGITADRAQFVPCDGPCPPPDLVARLEAALAQTGAAAAVPHDGDRLQPVHALLERRLAGDLAAAVAAGEGSPRRWLMRIDATVVDFSDRREAFENINTAEERRLMARRLDQP